MQHYVIRANVEPLGTGMRVELHEIRDVIDQLSGRPGINGYILTRAIRGNNRAAVGTNADSPGRAQFGRTFIVECVPHV